MGQRKSFVIVHPKVNKQSGSVFYKNMKLQSTLVYIFAQKTTAWHIYSPP